MSDAERLPSEDRVGLVSNLLLANPQQASWLEYARISWAGYLVLGIRRTTISAELVASRHFPSPVCVLNNGACDG